jgi:hypothetical protein
VKRYYFDFRGDRNESPTGDYMLASQVIPLLRQCEEALTGTTTCDTIEEILDAEAIVEATIGDLRRVLSEIDR